MNHINNTPTESFTWCGKPIPMPKDYKYLGGWIDKALTFAKHMDCVCKKARAAFARLIPYLRNNDIPIDYRMKAFDALITPLFGYACETWSSFSKTKRQRLDKLFSRLLCSCIGCLQSNRSEIIHALAGINDLSFTHEYFRMLFKYLISDGRFAADSFHMNLMESIEDSNTEYAKWCRRESADEVKCGFTDGEKPVPRFEIKGVLNTRRFNAVVEKYEGEENISLIDKNTILNKKRCYGNTSWLIRKWLSPRQFVTLCNILGGGEKMLYSKYCFRCGCENSVTHCLKECTLIENKEEDTVDLEKYYLCLKISA